MFHTRDLTCQWSPKGYIFCLNDFAHLRLSVSWGDYLEVHYLQTKLPHVWFEKNFQNRMFCPRHCSEDCVRLRVLFPVFERKHVHKCVLMGRDSVVGTATRYGLDSPGSNPGGGEILRIRPDRPWGPPSLLYDGYRVSFPGGKAAGAWRWPPTPSNVHVKERAELYLYSLSGPSWPVVGWTLPLPLPLQMCS
jgi:hypothetical protein